jgi:hypothetical protein
MPHDPALDAHEHTEHAEHAAHQRDPFISKITITVAMLAVFAAVAGSLETVEGGRALGAASEAVLKQDQATDSWNEFQADGLKRHIYTIASGSGGTLAAGYGKTAKREGAKQDKDKTTALDFEKERDALSRESQAHGCGDAVRNRHRHVNGSHHHAAALALVCRHRIRRVRHCPSGNNIPVLNMRIFYPEI